MNDVWYESSLPWRRTAVRSIKGELRFPESLCGNHDGGGFSIRLLTFLSEETSGLLGPADAFGRKILGKTLF